MSSSSSAAKANNPGGAATSSPWNASGFAFAPNTNTLDRNSMPSDAAEAARQKSAAVMDALRRGDPAEADRIMGKNQNTQGQLIPPGPINWLRKKFNGSSKKGDMVKSDDGASSVMSEDVEKESVIIDGKGKE